MRHALLHISLLMLLVLSLTSCDKTPRGVISVNDMADLIADLEIAEVYMESHASEFSNDSSKLVLKQSIFKKHGITNEDYDSSLVWYAHNMEDYVKAHDKAMLKLQGQYEKVRKNRDKNTPDATGREAMGYASGGNVPHGSGARHPKLAIANGDTIDLWQGKRSFMLTQGARRGFIPFDIVPDADKQKGDRYQLAYKLTRGGNDFKVSLNVDYTDGATSQVSRASSNDGWATFDVQSDTARQVRRVYGYVSYNIKQGSIAYVDSIMLVRTHMDTKNYGIIHAQRLLERNK